MAEDLNRRADMIEYGEGPRLGKMHQLQRGGNSTAEDVHTRPNNFMGILGYIRRIGMIRAA